MGWVGRQALAVYGLDKPTIAAVNGVAAGAGMSLALACDLRVGDGTARFRTVFAERSLSPDSGMSYFLPRIIGYSRAADLIFTSRDVGAEEAYRLGLLDRLVEADVVGAAVAPGRTDHGAAAHRHPFGQAGAPAQHDGRPRGGPALRDVRAGLRPPRAQRRLARRARASASDGRPASPAREHDRPGGPSRRRRPGRGRGPRLAVRRRGGGPGGHRLRRGGVLPLRPGPPLPADRSARRGRPLGGRGRRATRRSAPGCWCSVRATAADFNGTLVVCWNNVTAGFELLADVSSAFSYGFAFACVSAQSVGIDGVGQRPLGLRAWDPERYGDLVHPGDVYSYGIFTEAARALGPARARRGGRPARRPARSSGSSPSAPPSRPGGSPPT